MVSHCYLGSVYGLLASLRPHDTGAGLALLVNTSALFNVKASGSATGAAAAWEKMRRATGIMLRSCMLAAGGLLWDSGYDRIDLWRVKIFDETESGSPAFACFRSVGD